MGVALEAWVRCRGWLLPALEPGCGSEADLIGELVAGEAQLWVGQRAAMVTQRLSDARGPCLHVWLAGGELAEIMRMKDGVEAWARAQGCERITINGRRGWTRVLRGHGYAPVGGELERRL